jgi:FkbM family methyltransferase
MLNKLIYLLPENTIRALSRLQFRAGFFSPLFRWAAKNFVSGKGVIKYGLGKGLKFNSAGGAPGFSLGTTEPLEQDALAKYLKTGDVFFNIGANFGFFSILAKRLVGINGRVFAFEPVPLYAKRIKENAKLNNMDIMVIQKAAFDKNGVSQFDFREDASSLMREVKNGIEVETVRIDDLVEAGVLDLPNYCVIDVEGAEIEVLLGMVETISKCMPVLLVEVHWLGAKFIDFVEKFLLPMGYELKNLDPKKEIISDCERWHALLLPQR